VRFLNDLVEPRAFFRLSLGAGATQQLKYTSGSDSCAFVLKGGVPVKDVVNMQVRGHPEAAHSHTTTNQDGADSSSA
jgi:hypothetical protein